MSSGKFLATVALVLLAGATCSVSQATAPAIAIECDNCSDGRLYDIAVKSTLGMHLYYDLTQARITEWKVTREPGGHGTYLYAADPVDVEPLYADAFQRLSEAVRAYGRHAVDTVAVVNLTPRTSGFPTTLAGVNAYQVLRTSAYQNDLTDWAIGSSKDHPVIDGIGETLWELLGDSLNVLFQSDLVSVTFHVVLDDGSQVSFRWDAGAPTRFTDARDKNNNTIPLSAANVVGDYIFRGSPNGLVDWLQYMQWLGVTVDVDPTHVIGTVTVGCVATPTTSCVQQN